MTKIVEISSKHPLIGTWIGEGEESRCEYIVKPLASGLTVKAIDTIDGEELVISDVKWDDVTLEFTSLMPSTGRIGKNVMKLISDNEIEFKLTFTITEKWTKK